MNIRMKAMADARRMGVGCLPFVHVFPSFGIGGQQVRSPDHHGSRESNDNVIILNGEQALEV